jgi:predicted GTPase
VAVLRHPMPYGDLEAARVQRFASRADLAAAGCTVEEREEYEPHIAFGNVVFAGVDYAEVLERAQREADVIVWDGGNNDLPFIAPDLHLVVVDALRPGQTNTHHPGEAALRMADAVVVNKVNAASGAAVEEAMQGVRRINSSAPLVRAASIVRLDDPAAVRGKRVLVVEDGPTITHGGMPHGAGYAAALAADAGEIVDPRAYASGALREVYRQYPHIGSVLPAMGYSEAQRDALVQTIRASGADAVVVGTPIDLGGLLRLDLPVLRVSYEFADAGEPTLRSLVDAFLARAQA